MGTTTVLRHTIRRPRRLSSAILAAVVFLPQRSESATADNASADLLRGPGIANHPVGVVPSEAVAVPAGWPLDSRGALTCFTCHESLSDGAGHDDAGLRDFDAQDGDNLEFCMKCHSEATQPTAASMHWQAVGRAHVSADGGRRSAGGETLDADSRRCLGCHDGVTAVESVNPTALRGGGSFADRQRNHPIGVDYPSGPQRDRSVPFRMAAQLPATIQLPGGRVGCVSCHNLYAQSPDLLSVPIEGSQLCFTCHKLN